MENHALFQKWIKSGDADLPTLCKGLAKLGIVDVALDRDKDNPQLIFESMNSTGRELSQADLIRNFILMRLEPNIQTRLYEQFWRPMEVDFGQEAYGTHFDAFMRHYLTVMTGEIPNINGVYEAFKSHSLETRTKPVNHDSHIEILLASLRTYSRYFCAMALDKEIDQELRRAFHDLRELKVEVAYPFLLELYHDYTTGRLCKSDFVCIVRWVEAYVFRRAVCAIPTNSMNKTFANFNKALKKERYLESIAAHFLQLPSYRRFPRDDEFERDIQTRDLYNFRSRSYWLRRLENHERKEVVAVDEYSVEHILPQNENLGIAWKKELGDEWERIQQTWLHTLGNLTLTGYNSEYSDRPFAEKRDMEGGFKHSPLKMNVGLGQIEVWNEQAIKHRAKQLAKRAIDVWHGPKLDEAVLDIYRQKAQAPNGYSIETHPHLLSPTISPLFEAFRKEVLALDPCVTEEFLKLYVAYKAETNFVDVVPQAKRLRLSLNMHFPEITDPKGLCKDITGLHRWGNGDIEVGLSTLEELPYVLGLVRQALEKQLGGVDNG
jgi:predicted transport protein